MCFPRTSLPGKEVHTTTPCEVPFSQCVGEGFLFMSEVWGMNCARSLLRGASAANRSCWQPTDVGRSFRSSRSRAENVFRH